jgi:hypothetical protein
VKLQKSGSSNCWVANGALRYHVGAKKPNASPASAPWPPKESALAGSRPAMSTTTIAKRLRRLRIGSDAMLVPVERLDEWHAQAIMTAGLTDIDR